MPTPHQMDLADLATQSDVWNRHPSLNRILPIDLSSGLVSDDPPSSMAMDLDDALSLMILSNRVATHSLSD